MFARPVQMAEGRKETAQEAVSRTANCREAPMAIPFQIRRLRGRILNLVRKKVVVGRMIKDGNGMPMETLLRTLILRIMEGPRITQIRMSILICRIQLVARHSTALHDHCKIKLGV
jgi:hypothetical protein